MQRVILTTGGTGGHIFPALAAAEEIRSRWPSAMILFMGGEYGPEADIVAKAGLDFVGLPVRGVVGRGVRGVFAAFGMLRGIARAYRIIRKIRPQIVVGFGGYAAFAGVAAARLAGVPCALHEQNSLPGVTNKLLGRMAQRVFLSMPDEGRAFAPEKCRLVGNPVRAGIVELHERQAAAFGGAASPVPGGAPASVSYYGGVDAPSPFGVRRSGETAAEPGRDVSAEGSGAEGAAPDKNCTPGASAAAFGEHSAPGASAAACGGNAAEAVPGDIDASRVRARAPRLLVMGGSQGARAINRGVLNACGALLEAGVDIWHQTGQADYEFMRAEYRKSGAEHVRVEAFITDMPRAYAWADLVLCRAGATSLAELTAAGLAAVLVPFPFAARDHQRHNARFLELAGGAVVLEQDRFTPPEGDPAVLAEILHSLLTGKDRLEAMARNSFAQAKPYAAHQLVNGLEDILRTSGL